MFKNNLMVIFVIVLFTIFISTSTYADDSLKDGNNYEVLGVSYSTLKEAYDAITGTRGTIKVLNDCQDNSAITISREKEITINANGKTLSRTERSIINEGALFITGTGTIKASNDIDYLIVNRGSLSITNATLLHDGNENKQWAVVYSTSGSITLNSGVIQCGITNINALDQTHYALSIRGDTIVSIKDGQVSSTGEKGCCISVAANSFSQNATGTITISGGTIENVDGSAIIMGASDDYQCETDLIISSGTIKGKMYGIRAASENTKSNITITGGNIISTGSENTSRGISYTGIGNLTIGTRGKGFSTTSPSIQSDYIAVTSSNGFKFYDGVFKGKSASYINTGTIELEPGCIIKEGTQDIDGKTYKTASLEVNDPSSTIDCYLVNGNYYQTLGAAYNSINGLSGTIKVVRDCMDDSNVSIDINKTITINMNGKTIIKGKNRIINSGTLNITGGGTIQTTTDVTSNTLQYIISNTGRISINNTKIIHNGLSNKQWGAIYLDGDGVISVNGGTVKCTSTNEEALSQTSYTLAIRQNTIVDITNGTIINECVYNDNKSRHAIAVSANTTTGDARGSITINSGTIKSDGGTAIYLSGNGSAIKSERFDCYTDLTIVKGSIIGKKYGVYNYGWGMPTIGTEDGTYSQSDITIQGDLYGLYSPLNGFKLFDGTLKGKITSKIGGITKREHNYKLYYDTNNNYRILTMIPGNETIVEDDDFPRREEFHKAIKATIDSYRSRSDSIQYEYYLEQFGISPETATEDNRVYVQCGCLVWNVYNTALKIPIPLHTSPVTKLIKEYQLEHNNELPEGCVLNYGDNGEDFYNALNSEKGFVDTVLQVIEPGDIILMSQNRGGHLQMIYDLIKDDDGNIIDAWIFQTSSGGFESMYYEKVIPDYTFSGLYPNIYSPEWEGTPSMKRFSDYYGKLFTDDSDPMYFRTFTVLRPIANKNNEYQDVYDVLLNGKEKTDIYNLVIPDDTKDRMKYHDIYISKTCSENNNTVVKAGQDLTYTITIKNNSTGSNKMPYNNLSIQETIPDGATYISGGTKSGNKVTWSNISVAPGESEVFSYTVKVPNVLGKVLIAEGKVNNIPTTPVKNIVGNSFTSEQILALDEAISNKLKSSSKTGLSLADEIYKTAFGIEMNLDGNNVSDIINDFGEMISFNNMATLFNNDQAYDYMWQRKFSAPYFLKNQHYSNIMRQINLKSGEIVLSSLIDKDGNEENRAYIYLGNKLISLNGDGKEYSEDVFVVRNNNAQLTEIDDFFDRLFYGEDFCPFDTTESSSISAVLKENGKRVKNVLLSPANLLLSDLDVEHNYKVNDKYYPNLASAYKSIEESGEIIVLHDISDNIYLSIEKGKTITINTNGKTLTRDGNGDRSGIINNYGSLIITGDGTINVVNDSAISNFGSLIIDGMSTIKSYKKGVINNGILLMNNGVVNSEIYEGISNIGSTTINGGTIISENYRGVYNQGSFTMNGGTIKGITGIFHDGDSGDITINAGTIDVENNGIRVTNDKSATINVKGGTIISTSTSSSIRAISNSGNGSVIIGTKDGEASTTFPIIQSNYVAVESKNGFDFYDGVLKGKYDCHRGAINQIEDGYKVKNLTENEYKTEYLTPDIMKGDLNYDKEISIIDVRLLLQRCIDSNSDTQWSPIQIEIMDINDNTKIDIIDVRILLQRVIALGYID